MNTVKAAVANPKEIDWLYTDVEREKTGDNIVIDVAHSGTSTMLNKDEYLQVFKPTLLVT